MNAIAIFISTIRIDGGTQARSGIDDEVVANYAEALSNNAVYPLVVVFHDGRDYWLGDGFHRFHAHKHAGRDSILVEVHDGSQREALLYACGANAEHGLQRTIADKRKAVEMVLTDAEWGLWSDSDIARQCRVSRPFVQGLRKSL